ncbi:MAG: ribonuclease HI [uncultured bacterium]|uniref:Ribonuclease HI n=1 Tax=Candidatus Woesebacteria bacterium GW2011_GWA1_40_43 TaxID=1618553 RepID=A0A0G0SLH4_9BACT|nr:MAG: ribonuclease HI [uncultured bacterium]KKR51796.1 MAG: Ribonuclease HI [Candidatus Woesebacteria bacterium GW2011_GWD2_40_19]KKR57420.1 MAG: Ribonuclease HI [Candidatus Woesebacteria bacterium GW2011_GWC2_40_30]KKR63226.1 MAG: Ribonuclease HI [Candidatus Woesebacteria bacterium GW2011_GWA1_40_43]HAU65121.1 ribonuclease HI [Candidatus Woesebacteria bacterium]
MQNDAIIIHTDGGSRGNPGPAACAFVAELKGKVLEKQSKFLNTNTNNVAEYEGVLLALNWLLKSKHAFKENNVIFFLDSELVVKQLNGVYKIKKPELQILNLSIRKIFSELDKKIFFKHIPREQNKVADFLLNEELDKHF